MRKALLIIITFFCFFCWLWKTDWTRYNSANCNNY